MLYEKYRTAGRGSYACGETVRPIRACTVRHDSMKREARKTNKTVSGRSEFWEAPISVKQIGVVHVNAVTANSKPGSAKKTPMM